MLGTNLHQFRVAAMTHLNSLQNHYKFLKEKFSLKPTNLNSSKVRGESKVAVLNWYLVPSMRYHLTGHKVHKTHLEQLDLNTQKYLKQRLSGLHKPGDLLLLPPGHNTDYCSPIN